MPRGAPFRRFSGNAEFKKSKPQRLRRQYLKTPALPRPITAEGIQKWIQDQAGKFRARTDVCCVAITAITGDRMRLAGQCISYCEPTGAAIERRLESLPLLLDRFASAAEAEQAARAFEAYGATVELRPG